MEINKHLLIISDSHVLTPSIIKVFKNNSSWKICMIDTVENKDVDKFILFDVNNGFNEDNIKNIYTEIESFALKFDAMIHICANWEKSSIKSINIFSQTDSMFKKNYYFSLLSRIN
mgnify:CR=1 FL=1